MTNWNTRAPYLLGLQFFARNAPGVGPAYQIGAQAWAVAQTMPSTATESISNMGLHFGGVMTNYAALVEIINAGSEVPNGKNTAIYRPNGSANVTGWTSTEGTFENAVNGTSVNPAKYLLLSTGAATKKSGTFELEFATSGVLTGKRILAVRLKMVLSAEGAAGPVVMSLQVKGQGKNWGGSAYTPGGSGAPGTVVLDSAEVDPAAVQPWTLTALHAMDGSGYRFKFSSTMPNNPVGLNSQNYQIFQVWLEVDYCDENRQSTQVVKFLNTAPDWLTWPIRKPDGTFAAWSKVNGTAFTVVVRQPLVGNVGGFPYSFLVNVPYLRGFQDVPVTGLALYPGVKLAGDGSIDALNSESPADVIGVYLATTGPTQSGDSQPYAETLAIEVAGTVEQEIIETFTLLGADSMAFPLAYFGAPDDLTIELRRRSDSALLASVTVSTDDWDAAPPDPQIGVWRILQADFASVALVAPTVYYLSFSSGGPGSWFVQGLNTRTINGFGSYGNETLQATYGGGDVPETDIAALLVVLPDPPADVAGAAVGCD